MVRLSKKIVLAKLHSMKEDAKTDSESHNHHHYKEVIFLSELFLS